jgi:hypothetical protein
MKKNKYLISSLLFFSLASGCFFACESKINASLDINKDSIVIDYDSISTIREKPNKEAVASYYELVGDDVANANKWKFAAQLYETKFTFKYLLKMEYKEVRVTDTINIPNFAILPTVVIKKDTTPQSCIIGFLDKKKEFKAYKKLSVKNNQLKLTTINSYFVGVYKTKIK